MIRVHSASKIEGVVALPADKSISHRYAIISAMACGVSWIYNYSASQDCRSTLSCLRELGVDIEQRGTDVRVSSGGWEALRQPVRPLDAENSGTTIRLASALLACRPMESTIAGDASLNRRPMGRIVTPLSRMGAVIEAEGGQFPPLRIKGTKLKPINYPLPVASAQVKSCILLAGLTAGGRTTVVEDQPTRDHTERALPVFGAKVQRQGGVISVSGPVRLESAQVHVPGDFSSAVYFILAALMLPGSVIELPAVGLNATRTALLGLLLDSGARIEHRNQTKYQNEPVGDLRVSYSPSIFSSFPPEIGADLIPNLIDEIPALAVFATRLANGLVIRDAAELRTKESDRIRAIVTNLRSIGVEVEEMEDGLRVHPGQTIKGGRVVTGGDHRIAMAFSLAGLLSEQPVEIDNPSCSAVSFPGYFKTLERVAR